MVYPTFVITKYLFLFCLDTSGSSAVVKLSLFKGSVSSFGWDGWGGVLCSRLCWTIDSLSILMVFRVPFYSTVTIFSCTKIVLYGPVFFARSFCEESSAFLDVTD